MGPRAREGSTRRARESSLFARGEERRLRARPFHLHSWSVSPRARRITRIARAATSSSSRAAFPHFSRARTRGPLRAVGAPLLPGLRWSTASLATPTPFEETLHSTSESATHLAAGHSGSLIGPGHQTNSPTSLWVRSGECRTGQNSHLQTNSGSGSSSGQRLGHEPPRNQFASRSEATRDQASTRSAPCPCWAACNILELLPP